MNENKTGGARFGLELVVGPDCGRRAEALRAEIERKPYIEISGDRIFFRGGYYSLLDVRHVSQALNRHGFERVFRTVETERRNSYGDVVEWRSDIHPCETPIFVRDGGFSMGKDFSMVFRERPNASSSPETRP